MSERPGSDRRVEKRAETEELPLSKAVQNLLEECRMVLPGIQALFGFQLIAVINPAFAQKFDPVQQRVHLFAVGLVAMAIALIMAPAAYHRQTGPRKVSADFLRLSTRLLLWSMLPLAVGISLDFYLVAHAILKSQWVIVPAVGLLAFFTVFWFVLPRAPRLGSLFSR